VTFVEPNEEMRRRWTSVAAEATQALIGEQRYDRALVEEIQRTLEERRSGRGSTTAGG